MRGTITITNLVTGATVNVCGLCFDRGIYPLELPEIFPRAEHTATPTDTAPESGDPTPESARA
jgi:hypothetical protein